MRHKVFIEDPNRLVSDLRRHGQVYDLLEY